MRHKRVLAGLALLLSRVRPLRKVFRLGLRGSAAFFLSFLMILYKSRRRKKQQISPDRSPAASPKLTVKNPNHEQRLRCSAAVLQDFFWLFSQLANAMPPHLLCILDNSKLGVAALALASSLVQTNRDLAERYKCESQWQHKHAEITYFQFSASTYMTIYFFICWSYTCLNLPFSKSS